MLVGATVAQPLLVPLLREHLAPGSLAWAVLPWKPEHGARTAETRPPVPAPTGVPWPLSLRYAGLEELLLSLSQNCYGLIVVCVCSSLLGVVLYCFCAAVAAFLTGEGCDQGTDGHGVCACFAGITRTPAFAIGRATTRAALAAESPVRLRSPHHAPDVQLPRQAPMENHGDDVPGCHESCRVPYLGLLGGCTLMTCAGPWFRQKWRRGGTGQVVVFFAHRMPWHSKGTPVAAPTWLGCVTPGSAVVATHHAHACCVGKVGS